jgi:uncharacterized damage-inducible protein DinB
VALVSDTVMVELIRGKGAFTDAGACVSGLRAADAGARAGAPYSVYELVYHMNYWMHYELERIDGRSPVYPEHAAEGWPASAAPEGEAAWESCVARFEALLARMTDLAREPPTLDRGVEITKVASYANQGGSVRDVIWQTLVHNAYHLGQVALLRRMLGAWPPAGGGDTW